MPRRLRPSPTTIGPFGETPAPTARADSRPERQLDALDEEECRRLLGTAVIGRIAFTEQALPAVQPVHFALIGDDIYIPTRAGSKVAVASGNAVVAFEADSFDAQGRTGWNVTAVGRSRLVTDPAEAAELDALGLTPWAPADQPCYVAIRTSRWQGRRIRTVTVLA